MKKIFSLIAIICVASVQSLFAQSNADVVKSLKLSDATVAQKVQAILDERSDSLAQTYADYNKIISATDTMAPGRRDHVTTNVTARLNAKLYKKHFQTEVKLAAYLDDAQIEKVKDGLTYGLMPKYYDDLSKNLSKSEKASLKAKLRAAREYALDAPDQAAAQKIFESLIIIR